MYSLEPETNPEVAKQLQYAQQLAAHGPHTAVNKTAAQSQYAPSLSSADILKQYLSEIQGYQGPSAADMAQQQFAPQFNALDQMIAAKKQQYGTASSDIGNMWNALADSTANKAGQVKQMYDAATGYTQGNYNNAINAIQGTYSNSKSQTAELLQRLGIAQAGPDVFRSADNSLMNAVSGASNMNQAATNLLQQLGVNAQDYTRKTADTYRMAGRNAQDNLQRAMLAALGDLDIKKLELMSQQKAAENEYGLSISKQDQDARDSALNYYFKQAELDRLSKADDQDWQLGQGRLMLDTEKWKSGMANDDRANTLAEMKLLYDKGSPFELLQNAASRSYSDPRSAANAAAVIASVYQDTAGERLSLNEFLQAIDDADPSAKGLDRTQRRNLASQFYYQLAKGDPDRVL